MSDAHLYAAARTPFGRSGGALTGVRPDDLAATVLTGLLDKTPDLDPAAVGDEAVVPPGMLGMGRPRPTTRSTPT